MTKEADDIRLLPNDLQSLQFTLPFRTDEGAKQDFGRAVIVGGSASFVGAPCFAAESAAEVLALAGEAAMRSGAGTTVLALPDILLPALYPHLRYSAAFALPSSGGNIVFDEAAAKKLFRGATSVAMGMGMADGDAYSYARLLLDETDATLVLDADALNIIAEDLPLQDLLLARREPTVLTPHAMEAARLLRRDVKDVTVDRVAAARELAVQTGAIVVLKGPGTVTTLRSSRAWINPTGSAMLATAGTGDVLAGMIGAMFAQKFDMVEATLSAVWLHGRAVEGLEAGVTASSVARRAADLLNKLRQS